MSSVVVSDISLLALRFVVKVARRDLARETFSQALRVLLISHGVIMVSSANSRQVSSCHFLEFSFLEKSLGSLRSTC